MSFFILNSLKQIRINAIRQEYTPILNNCPDSYIANFCTVSGAADHLQLIKKLIGDDVKKILVVGVFGGRDFWGLRALGHNVTGLNLTPDDNCPITLVGNAEDPWPFDNESFDAVVMGEILEHLVEDKSALLQAERVLNQKGKLIITVPFLHDEPEYHIRVHTPKSIQRILRFCGFNVEFYLERPGLPFMKFINYLLNFSMLVCYFFTKKTFYKISIQCIANFEFYFSSRFNLIRSIAGKARIINWGCLILCSKSDLPNSYIDLNIDAFTKTD